MIGASVLLALSSGIAAASVIVALFAWGLGAHAGAWALVPGAIAAVVALFERNRIRSRPLDADRPGIRSGDE